jgi:hypothetical protein
MASNGHTLIGIVKMFSGTFEISWDCALSVRSAGA